MVFIFSIIKWNKPEPQTGFGIRIDYGRESSAGLMNICALTPSSVVMTVTVNPGLINFIFGSFLSAL
jgi:hypothetical protein